jgi:hypothetical protein
MPVKATVRTRLVVALALVLLGLAPAAWASIITPPGLSPGDPFRLVFISSQAHDATSTNIAVYDAFVAGLASAAGLDTYNGSPVTWQALASTATTSAIFRLPADTIPIYRLDGVALADGGGADLWDGTLDAPHSPTELGQPHPFPVPIWTGTDPSGNPLQPLGTELPTFGRANVATSDWVTASASPPVPNTFTQNLYAFSSVLTAQTAVPEPEPGTLTLLLVALGGLVGVHLNRRRRAAASRR